MVLRDADIYFQPDATDPVLADDLVLSLVRRHVPAARAVTGIDETGGEARVYEIDDDVIFKTQRPHRARDRTSLKKEVFFLGQLASDAEVSVPKVLGYGRESEHIEYTCMTRMPGVTLRSVDCEGETRRQVFRAVGQMLRRIHSLPQQPFVENELLPGDRAAGDVRRRFEALYANDEMDDRAVSDVMTMLDGLGARDYAQAVAEEQGREAARLIAQAELDPGTAAAFDQLTDFMVHRNH